ALLAGYLVNNQDNLPLDEYLDKKVFAGDAGVEIVPTAEEVAGFNAYLQNYMACLPVEAAAVNVKK
ncbi:MAG: ATPase, partial [Bacteroidales bacterium]|nr:ATPase [Bacteroidales bacterium]